MASSGPPRGSCSCRRLTDVSALRTRGGRLAIIVAATLVLVIGVAAAGVFGGRSGSQPRPVRPSRAAAATRHGALAFATAQTFARTVHPRVANTWGEIGARTFVTGVFQQYAYTPRSQEFIAGAAGRRVHSANIIAVKQGDSANQLVIGAHYDSAAVGEGYLDNATGIGLLLEMAARLKTRPTPYTLVFVAFGAEENGTLGSRYYVRSLPDGDLRRTIGMIDLDAVAGGDQLSVTSRFGSPTWLRDDALSAAKGLGVPLQSSLAVAGRPAGITLNPSDDDAFATAGVATAAFTALDWRLSGESGAVVTAEDGRLWHTRKDTVAYVQNKYPGRVAGQLRDLSRVLDVLLTSKLGRHP
jgi:alkaline phosphatase isozyme conversion protein